MTRRLSMSITIKMMGAILKIQLLAFFLAIQSHCYFQYNFDSVADSGNYTCDEMTRWLGSEKHYSNDKKDVLFGLLANQDCQKNPVVFLTDVSFGYSANGKKLFFQPKLSARKQDSCKFKDRLAVVYLSNFSINRNFSHFLHGLLRLFCALIDARWIVWDNTFNRFRKKENYTLWLDEYFQLTPSKKIWLGALSENIRHMGKELAKGTCVSSDRMLYGSGCVKLLPPEKWFGYPGCRAGQVLPAFGQYIRQMFNAASAADLFVTDSRARGSAPGVKVAFAVRAVGDLTGRREISNLGHVQALLRKTQHVNTVTENVTFEHFDVQATVQYMAKVHIFVSVHGAGMTNMFFMNPGSAVVEIIPFPLCNCRSPDYFYGSGGYYHGSAVAQDILHYSYCVPPQDQVWHTKPTDAKSGAKCSWKHLHAVESITLDASKFVSLMRKVERDLVVKGTIRLTAPIINMGPHANGRL